MINYKDNHCKKLIAITCVLFSTNAIAATDFYNMLVAPPDTGVYDSARNMLDAREQRERRKIIDQQNDIRFAQQQGERQRQQEVELQTRQRSQQAQEENEKFQERLRVAAKDDPSIIDIANDNTLPVSEAMAEVIRSSDAAPALLKWLNGNRREAQRIAGLPPIAAANALGKFEATLAASPKPETARQESQAQEW